MRYALLILSITLLLLSMAGCAPAREEACGFIQNGWGQRITWGRLPVSFRINGIVPARADAIRRAAHTWGAFYEVLTGPAQVEIVELSSWEGPPNEQARASVHWVGNRIDATIIKINLNHNPDLESLMLHELGHVLGLKHENGTVMHPTLGYNEIRRKLTAHELESLQCGY